MVGLSPIFLFHWLIYYDIPCNFFYLFCNSYDARKAKNHTKNSIPYLPEPNHTMLYQDIPRHTILTLKSFYFIIRVGRISMFTIVVPIHNFKCQCSSGLFSQYGLQLGKAQPQLAQSDFHFFFINKLYHQRVGVGRVYKLFLRCISHL